MRQGTTRRLTYESKLALKGFTFLIPWLLGTIFFFLIPLISTLVYSVNDVKVTDEGLSMQFSGLTNYIHAFRGDKEFLPRLSNSLLNMLYQVPFIMLFSLFIAFILSRGFRGQLLYRSIFFLPVIISSGVIISLIRGDASSQAFLSGDRSAMMFQAFSLENLMIRTGVPPNLVSVVMGVVNNLFELAWRSGVQILVFIAGFKAVPDVLYEVAHTEGANAWESFWMISFPMIAPMILVNLVYTIIDSLNDYLNPLTIYISETTNKLDIKFSSAMSWIYSIVIFIIVGVLYGLINRKVFQYVD